jgi:hypothetical protein
LKLSCITMRTGPRILKGITVLYFFVCSTALIAQDDDTVKTSPFERFWTRPRVVPKVGFGVQDRPFFTAGFALQNIYKHPLTLLSKGPYAVVDVFIDDSNTLVAPKVGYEFTAGVFGAALDVSYFIDHNYNDEGSTRRAWAVTPKVGLSILGFANLYYGYQIPLSETEITSITRNQFTLTVNINKDYFDLKGAPRQR